MLEADFRLLRGDLQVEATFSIGAGETVALVGPNGAGKSTILEVLAGVRRSEAGRITFDGQVWEDDRANVRLPAWQRPATMVFQDHRLFPNLTVRENLAFGPRAQRLASRTIRAKVEETIERFGLGDLADRDPKGLSGGEKQLVAVARSVIVQPRLLLLDEPTASLDAEIRPRLRALLREVLSDPTRSHVLVTHDPVDALGLADRVIVVENGRTGESGSVMDIAKHPKSQYAARFVGLNRIEGHGSSVGTHVEVRSEIGSFYVVPDQPIEDGEVACVFHPSAVALSLEEPRTSARNVLHVTVREVTVSGGRARVDLGAFAAEVTPSALEELRLAEGVPVYAAIKATQITVVPK